MGHRPTVGGLFHRQGTYVAGGDRMMRPPSTCWVPAAANRFACFLSHFKAESGSDARYLRDLLQRMLGCPVFLDSSDLTDLRALFTDGVHRSDVLVLLATEKLLTRPWCILELWEAVKKQIPVVIMEVRGRGWGILISATTEASSACHVTPRIPTAHTSPATGALRHRDLRDGRQHARAHRRLQRAAQE